MGTRAVVARIFEQEIGFELIEKYNQIRIAEYQRKDDYFAPKVRYGPNGILEFRGSQTQA